MTASFFLNQPLTNWVYFLISLTGGLLVGKAIGFFITHHLKSAYRQTNTQLDDILAKALQTPLTLLAGGLGFFWGLKFLALPTSSEQWLAKGFRSFVVIIGGYFTLSLIDNFQNFYAKVWVKRTASNLDDVLLPLVARVIKMIVAALFILSALNTFGIDTTSILAGMGIGGLAIAMASRDTLSDLFGSLAVFADKPFRVGDLIKIGDICTGYVEEVTLRSTRVRTLEGTLVAIPNRKLAEETIEDLSLSSQRRVILEFDLSPNLTSDDVRKSLQAIRSALAKAEYVADGFRVHLTGLGKEGWGVEINFVLVEESYTRFNEIRERILFSIQKLLETSG